MITLSANYSCNVDYGGTVIVTFTIPNGYTYIGCGIIAFTCSVIRGGMSGNPTITSSNNIITLSAYISGNWGKTTVTGSVTIAVFVM